MSNKEYIDEVVKFLKKSKISYSAKEIIAKLEEKNIKLPEKMKPSHLSIELTRLVKEKVLFRILIHSAKQGYNYGFNRQDASPIHNRTKKQETVTVSKNTEAIYNDLCAILDNLANQIPELKQQILDALTK